MQLAIAVVEHIEAEVVETGTTDTEVGAVTSMIEMASLSEAGRKIGAGIGHRGMIESAIVIEIETTKQPDVTMILDVLGTTRNAISTNTSEIRPFAQTQGTRRLQIPPRRFRQLALPQTSRASTV